MADDDGGPPAAESEHKQGAGGKRCAHCGAAFDTSDWYPVTTERDGAGSLQFYSFCSEDCQTAWLGE